MIEIWTDGHRPVTLRSWGDGPITVARPLELLRPGGSLVPATAGYAIYHRKTGRALATRGKLPVRRR